MLSFMMQGETMNTNMLAIVKQIIAEQGEGILDSPQRLKAFFADYARDEQMARIASIGTVPAQTFSNHDKTLDQNPTFAKRFLCVVRVRFGHGALSFCISKER